MKILRLLGDAFLDHNGGVSSLRIVTVLISVTVLGVWISFMIIEGRYIPLGYPEAGLIGACAGAKAAQSHFELGKDGLSRFEEG